VVPPVHPATTHTVRPHGLNSITNGTEHELNGGGPGSVAAGSMLGTVT
jgi:hypothetical protein